MTDALRRALARRRLLQLLGLAGLAPAALPLAAQASDPPAKPGEAPAPPPAPEPDSTEISEEARRLAEVARQRYGQYLSEKDLEDLAEDIDGGLQAGKRLREMKFANSDEPDFVFHA